MTNTTSLIPVPFAGETVFYLSVKGEQMVPVRTICDNLGIAWQPQQRKLMSARDRWGVTIMVTETNAGPREAVCIPLRRLFAWLLSIHPSKLEVRLRKKLIAYQQKCDEVLYRAWTEQHEEAPRLLLSAPRPVVREELLTPLSRKVLRYRRLGLGTAEISRLLGCGKTSVLKLTRSLRESSLLEGGRLPDGQPFRSLPG